MARGGKSKKRNQRGGRQIQDQGKQNQGPSNAGVVEKLADNETRAAETDNALAQSEVECNSMLAQLRETQALLAEKEGQLLQKEGMLAAKDGLLAENQSLLAQMEQQLAEKTSLLSEKEQQLAAEKASIIMLTAAFDRAQQATVQAQKGEEAAREELAAQAELLSKTQTDLAGLKGDMEAMKGEMQSLKEERALSEKAQQAAEDTLASMEHLQQDLQTKCAENDQLLASQKADLVAHDKAIEALQNALKKEQQLRQQAEAVAGSKKSSSATQTLVTENRALRASARQMEAVGSAQLNEMRAANAKLLGDLAQARRHGPPMRPTAGCPPMGPVHHAASYPPLGPAIPAASCIPMVPMHPANMAPCYMGAPMDMGYSPVRSPIGAYNVMNPFTQRPNMSCGATNHATNKSMPPPNGNHRPSVGKFSHNRPQKTTFPQRR